MPYASLSTCDGTSFGQSMSSGFPLVPLLPACCQAAIGRPSKHWVCLVVPSVKLSLLSSGSRLPKRSTVHNGSLGLLEEKRPLCSRFPLEWRVRSKVMDMFEAISRHVRL